MKFIIFALFCFGVAMWLPEKPRIDKFAQLTALIKELWGIEL